MHECYLAPYMEAFFESSRIAEPQNMMHLSLQPYCVNDMLCSFSRVTPAQLPHWRDASSIATTDLIGQGEPDTCKCLQMRTLRERMKELQNNHDAQVSIVLEKYQSLRRQVQQYHELLEAATAPTPSNDVDTASLSSAVKAITLR